MTHALALRALGLAAVAFVAAVAALALFGSADASSNGKLPEPVTWYTAKAAPYGPTAGHTRTVCGEKLDGRTLGVAHPVLPCGVKIFIVFGGSRPVLTQVIDRGPSVPGREFDITKALAARIGLHGTQTIRWGFAR
jgi:peptidoglycan lytic transglycosylase